MFETLLIIGITCVIGAVVGGGLQIVNVKLPLVESVPRQFGLALVGLAIIGADVLWVQDGDDDEPAASQSATIRVPTEFPTGPIVGAGRPTLTLSDDEGPAGTSLRVSGSGFAPGETVRIRFHTEEVGKATADSDGAFADIPIEIPDDWQFTGQFMITAVGDSSIRSQSEPFEVT